MAGSIALHKRDIVELAEELYGLICALDDSRLTQAVEVLRGRCNQIQRRVQRLKAQLSERYDTLHASLDSLSQALRTRIDGWNADALREYRSGLAERYENLLWTIKRDRRIKDIAARLRSIRPTNYSRNLFHVSMGVACVVFYQWIVGRSAAMVIMGSIVALYAALEIARRVWPSFNDTLVNTVFAKIVRPGERYRIPSATYYAASILIMLFFASQLVTQVAILVLAFGDPVASLVGMRWGRRTIRPGKSWAGTLAFVGVSILVVTLFLIALKGMSVLAAAPIALLAASTGAVAELLATDRIDDNLTIGLSVALVLTLVL